MILAGDAGGTKTVLALFDVREGRPESVCVDTFSSREFSSLESIIGEFLSGRGPVDRACIGVAGPVLGGRSRLTNLAWTVEEESIRRACGAERAYLVNDLQAMAFSIPFLPPDGFAVLQAGEADPEGTIAVVAAGTGLGVGFLARRGGGYIPFASEGGHAGFAPRDERETRLLLRLIKRYGRASAERLVSGPGLHELYLFIREEEGAPDMPGIEARMAREDPPRVIAEEGISGRSPACLEALRFFASLYGSVSGDLALGFLATGGIVLGGGVAPAILPVLAEGGFVESFAAKGRFRDLLSRIPVKVILEEGAALHGAARYALAMEGAKR